MNAIDTLMTEHRLIERVLDALDAFSRGLQRNGFAQPESGAATAEKQELARFVIFIREFADRCHHGKEEGILFEEMVADGFPSGGGPIAVMLEEHKAGRALVRTLAGMAEQEGAWGAADRKRVAGAAQEYTTLLRQHIQKEDRILYPMAESRLSPEVMRRIGERAERFEVEQTGAGEHERLHALAEDLVARHIPAAGSAEDSGAHQSHCCVCSGS
jgi:hemerythrin-like domain-containing protein